MSICDCLSSSMWRIIKSTCTGDNKLFRMSLKLNIFYSIISLFNRKYKTCNSTLMMWFSMWQQKPTSQLLQWLEPTSTRSTRLSQRAADSLLLFWFFCCQIVVILVRFRDVLPHGLGTDENPTQKLAEVTLLLTRVPCWGEDGAISCDKGMKIKQMT